MTTVYLSTGDKSKSPRGVLYRETALILCCGLDKAMTPALSLSNSRTIWWAFSRQLQGWYTDGYTYKVVNPVLGFQVSVRKESYSNIKMFRKRGYSHKTCTLHLWGSKLLYIARSSLWNIFGLGLSAGQVGQTSSLDGKWVHQLYTDRIPENCTHTSTGTDIDPAEL